MQQLKAAFRLTPLVVVLFFLSRAAAQDDVADVPSERVALAEKQTYFLIGNTKNESDAKPRPLLLILPGGDGSEEFNPFVRRIYQNALPNDFVVAQLVAVATDAPNNPVWPTSNAPHPKQKFTTESFIEAVVADVSKRVKIDPDRVMALGWSSSGPALYTAAATKGSSLKKLFIAMSVFRPQELPDAQEVKGRRFYLLHSPDDQTCPIRLAQKAKTELGKLGATVTLTEYDGGHGWHGDLFGNIRTGIQWLEQPSIEQ